MPISGNVNLIASLGANNETDYEPVKDTCFKASFNLAQLVPSLAAQNDNYKNYLTKIAAQLSTSQGPFEVNFKPPEINSEVRTIKGQGNASIRYSGWTEYGPATMSFYNYLTQDTYSLFYMWAAAAGGLLLTNNSNVSVDVRTSGARFVPSGVNPAFNYKTNVLVSQYYMSGAKVETAFNVWMLQGVWPSAVSVAALNNAGDGEAVLTSVTFAVDICLPQPIGSAMNPRPAGPITSVAAASAT